MIFSLALRYLPTRYLAGFALSILLIGTAHADVLYDGFADTTGLQINGQAATASTADGTVLRVTPAQGNRAGSLFSSAQVSTSEFISIFSFRIADSGGGTFDFNNSNGADGIVFVVQNVANNVGSIGQGIGYSGISTSVGVEYDTWGNSSNADPSQSHIGIDLNGSVNHGASGMGPTAIIGNSNAATTDLPGPELDSGDRWWSWVRYDGTDLDVFLLQTNSITEPTIPNTPLLSFPLDLQTTLGGSQNAFVGFTSATGGAWANHDLLYWRYTESLIPEPTSMVLLAISSTLFLRRNSR